jgi:NAD(P)-dependent dehydrogenase (short-subunit alcohol dehydrogenase family)
MKDFATKTALVSGGASGIGLLTAQRLAAAGAKVVIADVNLQAAEAAIEGIRILGGSATAVKADNRRYEEVQNAVRTALGYGGHLDILLNCAGGAAARVFGRSEAFKDLDIEIIDWGIDVNLRGAVYYCHAAIGHMMERKAGVIVNLGSVEGTTGTTAIEYGAAKSGIIGLTKSLAIYAAPYGIRVCCVSPGPVLTRPAMAKMSTLLGRAAEPFEVVDLIEYLCSDKAAFITGTNYLIDGGRSCGVISYPPPEA